MKKYRILEVIDKDGKSKFHVQRRRFFLWWADCWYLEWQSMDGEFTNYERMIYETLQEAQDVVAYNQRSAGKVVHECPPAIS